MLLPFPSHPPGLRSELEDLRSRLENTDQELQVNICLIFEDEKSIFISKHLNKIFDYLDKLNIWKLALK